MTGIMTTRELTVSYYAAAADAAGVGSERFATDATTLGELGSEIAGRHGERMGQIIAVSVYLLGDALVRDPVTPIGEHTHIDVLPPFAGG